MENIKDYQQYLRGYNYTGITPVIIDFYATWCGHYDLQLMIVRMIHNYNLKVLIALFICKVNGTPSYRQIKWLQMGF
jgi:hypothetical protein